MNSFKEFGVMLDCSRNAVMNVTAVKKFIDLLSIMGYNTLQLYTEDTYEVKNEPYFGYLRGRYTAQEIKEIDRYAKDKGIELIPCIQTLAHFDCLFNFEDYGKIYDIPFWKEKMDSFWIYIVMALAAVVVVWGAFVGIKIAIAHKNEEKINARDMVKNLIIGIIIIFVVAMGAPLLINGLSAWVGA